MRTVSALEVRRRFGELLDQASAGDRIVIERDRRPMAMLVSYEDGMRLGESREDRLERRLAALDRLDAFRERMAREYPEPPDAPTAEELIRRERDHGHEDGG